MSARRLLLRVLLGLCVLGAGAAFPCGSALAASAPAVERVFVVDAGVSQVDIGASVNPGELDTTYHFEYGPSAVYGSSTKVANLSASGAGELVSAHITGLAPGSIYHFRVLASNVEGTAEGSDGTFRTFDTPGPFELPDKRAYEMVSPTEKNGADILTESWNTRSSTDGDAVQYASLGAFADAKGILYQAQYIGLRTNEGWETHSITPPTSDLGKDLPGFTDGASYIDDFSPDLSKGLFRTFPPVTAAPNVAAVTNLYMNRDQLTPGASDYRLISDCPGCASPLPSSTYDSELTYPSPPIQSIPVGTSADFSHVVFESTANLTADASGVEPKLYEWEEGTVRLVGQVPSSGAECGPGGPACVAAESSLGGSGVGTHRIYLGANWAGTSYTPNMVSKDGSRVFFTTPPYLLMKNTGLTYRPTGNIFMRANHQTTVQINAGQSLADLWTATADGRKVFYMTENGELYVFEPDKPPAERRTLLASNADEVIGISADGSYVYFTSATPLVPGQPQPGSSESAPAIYLWHNGTLSFVGINNAQDNALGSPMRYESLTGGSSMRVTPKGYLVFATHTPQTAYDTTSSACAHVFNSEERCNEIYIYSPSTDRISCASCNPTGAQPAGEAEFTIQDGAVFTYPNQHLNRVATEDGSRVFFSSPDALVPQDTNGRYDAYSYDSETEKISLISTGQCGCDSYFVEASPDGHDVFFTTTQQLVRIDTDNLRDLYDARVDGGIAAQTALPAAECQGDSCQAPAITPIDSTPSSFTYSGAGNPVVLKPAVKAKKQHRTVKKQHRTVKKRRAKRHRSNKRSPSRSINHNRGGVK